MLVFPLLFRLIWFFSFPSKQSACVESSRTASCFLSVEHFTIPEIYQSIFPYICHSTAQQMTTALFLNAVNTTLTKRPYFSDGKRRPSLKKLKSLPMHRNVTGCTMIFERNKATFRAKWKTRNVYNTLGSNLMENTSSANFFQLKHSTGSCRYIKSLCLNLNGVFL